jgi:hypothetical protein
VILGAARKIGLDGMIGPAGERCRDLVLAMIATDQRSWLETGSRRALMPETATSSLGTILDLGGIDKDERYAALDWLGERQPVIKTALAKRLPKNGTLVLYGVSSSYMEGSCCSLARGYSRDGHEGLVANRLRVALRAHGCLVAIEMFAGDTGDSTTFASQIRKLKQRFGLDHVVLVGNRGMITQARLTEDIRPGGLDWLTALRAPAIKGRVMGGALQLCLFDQRGMASITSHESRSQVWNALSAASRQSILTSVRCITGWPIGSARTSSRACWPVIRNGTCDENWRRCYSTRPTKRHRSVTKRSSTHDIGRT